VVTNSACLFVEPVLTTSRLCASLDNCLNEGDDKEEEGEEEGEDEVDEVDDDEEEEEETTAGLASVLLSVLFFCLKPIANARLYTAFLLLISLRATDS
jgi:hypothetical protein